jgi:hypothetical protein
MFVTKLGWGKILFFIDVKHTLEMLATGDCVLQGVDLFVGIAQTICLNKQAVVLLGELIPNMTHFAIKTFAKIWLDLINPNILSHIVEDEMFLLIPNMTHFAIKRFLYAIFWSRRFV